MSAYLITREMYFLSFRKIFNTKTTKSLVRTIFALYFIPVGSTSSVGHFDLFSSVECLCSKQRLNVCITILYIFMPS